MNTTSIEWTDRTWSPVTGCTPVSEGCRHCYARRMAKRLRGRCGYPADDPFRVTTHWDRMGEPERFRKPTSIFVCSMGDLFHSDVPDGTIQAVWCEMSCCPQHTFNILSKRPARFASLQEWGWYSPPLPNVRLGVSASNQPDADKWVPLLLQTQAACRFVSLEPMLGPVDIAPYLPQLLCDGCGRAFRGGGIDDPHVISGRQDDPPELCGHIKQTIGLDWVILGGETGPGARPCHPDWVRSVRDQCAAAGVPFFFKGWGEWVPDDQEPIGLSSKGRSMAAPAGEGRPCCPGIWRKVGKKRAGRVLDGRTHEEMPTPLPPTLAEIQELRIDFGEGRSEELVRGIRDDPDEEQST